MKALCVAMLIVLGLATGCGKRDQASPGDMTVSVVAVPAQQQAVEETLEAVGTLTANERVEIKSETDGTVEALHFEEGQQVKAGQLLVELDQAKLRAALAEAQANLTMAEATWQRYAALLQSGAVAQQEADQAQATLAAHHALAERLTAEMEDATITAAFEGVTGARLLSVGQFISRGTSITTLIDPDPMKLEFRIPERFLGQITLQQAVKISTAAYPDLSVVGAVYFIDPQIDPATRTVLLKARMSNPAGQLRHGMFAQVKLIVQVNEDAVVIPDTALLHQADHIFVYTIDGEQKAQMRPVTIGARLADSVEVIEGLQPGEQVVTEGHQKLYPGATVSPHPPQPAAGSPNPS